MSAETSATSNRDAVSASNVGNVGLSPAWLTRQAVITLVVTPTIMCALAQARMLRTSPHLWSNQRSNRLAENPDESTANLVSMVFNGFDVSITNCSSTALVDSFSR